MSKVKTRFAPSPTGDLHIGGLRTALFNYLYAKSQGGEFVIRVEDTDSQRSTDESLTTIIEGLRWLGIDDVASDYVYQSQRVDRHVEIANQLLARDAAYLDDGAVRIRSLGSGEMVISDLVQGRVAVSYEEIDEYVILRSDGTPTYMLASAVDDYDMGITHVIRGDDHLNNAFRQRLIYDALGWDIPAYAHIPLIHDEDGSKMSKRSGNLYSSTQYWIDQGIPREAMFSYLLRLGWGDGDKEFFTMEEAIEAFDVANVRKSPARFDAKKLLSVSAHYVQRMDPTVITIPFYRETGVDIHPDGARDALVRSKTLNEAVTMLQFYAHWDNPKVRLDVGNLLDIPVWKKADIEAYLRQHAASLGISLGRLVKPLRLQITMSEVSPPLFAAMEYLGRDEVSKRLA